MLTQQLDKGFLDRRIMHFQWEGKEYTLSEAPVEVAKAFRLGILNLLDMSDRDNKPRYKGGDLFAVEIALVKGCLAVSENGKPAPVSDAMFNSFTDRLVQELIRTAKRLSDLEKLIPNKGETEAKNSPEATTASSV